MTRAARQESPSPRPHSPRPPRAHPAPPAAPGLAAAGRPTCRRTPSRRPTSCVSAPRFRPRVTPLPFSSPPQFRHRVRFVAHAQRELRRVLGGKVRGAMLWRRVVWRVPQSRAERASPAVGTPGSCWWFSFTRTSLLRLRCVWPGSWPTGCLRYTFTKLLQWGLQGASSHQRYNNSRPGGRGTAATRSCFVSARLQTPDLTLLGSAGTEVHFARDCRSYSILLYLFKAFFPHFHPFRDLMLMSAKFSYHLNKSYSIIASAGSNKLTLENRERGLLSLRHVLQGQRDTSSSYCF